MEFTQSASDQIICMDCGETIVYLNDPKTRRIKLYPVRCDACVREMIESGVAAREGYNEWEVRFVP